MPATFFPLRSNFMPAEGEDWMPATDMAPGNSGEVTCAWVDISALSGEKFLRLSAPEPHSSWAIPVVLPGAGVLQARLRSRQQTRGQWQIVHSAGHVLAEGSLTPSTEWGDFTLFLAGGQGPASLVLRWHGEGTWDVRSLGFKNFHAEAWQAEVRGRETQAWPRNLLPISRFPLGLPQGWTVNRESSLGDELVLRADRTACGPSGSPALLVRANEAGWVRSPAFFPWPNADDMTQGRPHRASVQVRGRGEGELRVLEGSRIIARGAFVAAEDWAAVVTDFLSPAGEVPLVLEIVWKTENSMLWLDAVQVAPLPKSPGRHESLSFSGRGQTEIALAPMAHEAVYFPEEAWQVRWSADAPENGARVHWQLSDLYGQQVVGAIPLPAAHLHREEVLTLPDSGLSSWGSFRLNAWIEAADDQGGFAPISPVAEVILHRLPRPRFGFDRAPDSHFGVHVLPTRQHLYLAKAVGFNWVRLHGPGAEINYWFHVEPEPGEWCLRPDRLERYRLAGFSVLGKFTSTPRWASGQTEVAHGYFDQFVAPRDLAQWQAYVTKLLETYGDKIDVYEVWNEPWLDKFFSAGVEKTEQGGHLFVGLEDPVRAYAELTRATRSACDAGSWRPPLIGLNTTTNQGVAGWIDGDEWTRRAGESGILEDVQILSYHDYEQAATPVGQFAKTRERFAFALGPLLDDAGRPPGPVWNTEGSAQPEGLSPGLYRWLLPEPIDYLDTVWDEAERQARSILAQRVDGVAKIFLYTMHNSMGFAANNSFSVVLAPDGTLHPAGAAFACLAQWIDGLDFLEQRRVEDSDSVRGSLLRFGHYEQPTVEIFLADGGATNRLPAPESAAAPWHDLFGNPVADSPPRGFTFFRKIVRPSEA